MLTPLQCKTIKTCTVCLLILTHLFFLCMLTVEIKADLVDCKERLSGQGRVDALSGAEHGNSSIVKTIAWLRTALWKLSKFVSELPQGAEWLEMLTAAACCLHWAIRVHGIPGRCYIVKVFCPHLAFFSSLEGLWDPMRNPMAGLKLTTCLWLTPGETSPSHRCLAYRNGTAACL